MTQGSLHEPSATVYDAVQAKFTELITSSIEEGARPPVIENDEYSEWMLVEIDGLPAWISRSHIDIEEEGVRHMITVRLQELWADSFPLGENAITTTKPRDYIVLSRGDVFETANINRRPYSRQISELEKENLRQQIERAKIPGSGETSISF